MSLQSDLERCLAYAQALEDQQEQLTQAQNNIIFMQNESERLKGKLRICTMLSLLGAVVTLFFTAILIAVRTDEWAGILAFLILSAGIFTVSLAVRIKTKKESHDLESRKPDLIQQYSADADRCRDEMIRLIREIHQEELLDIVPQDYFSVAAIEFCLTRVRKKLANTAAEAFLQLEDEIRRMEQMEYLEQLNQARMEQLEEIKRAIDINTLVTLAEQDKKKS